MLDAVVDDVVQARAHRVAAQGLSVVRVAIGRQIFQQAGRTLRGLIAEKPGHHRRVRAVARARGAERAEQPDPEAPVVFARASGRGAADLVRPGQGRATAQKVVPGLHGPHRVRTGGTGTAFKQVEQRSFDGRRFRHIFSLVLFANHDYGFPTATACRKGSPCSTRAGTDPVWHKLDPSLFHDARQALPTAASARVLRGNASPPPAFIGTIEAPEKERVYLRSPRPWGTPYLRSLSRRVL